MFAALVGALSGCTSIESEARVRAANELRCSPSEVSVEDLGSGGWRASGCGHEATFVCSQPYLSPGDPAYAGVTTCTREGEILMRESPLAQRPPPASGAAFDEGAALDVVRPAVVAAVLQCRAESGPRGAGRASITFAPDGSASSAVLDERFDGTPLGACLSEHLRRSSKVPAFVGEPKGVHVHFFVVGAGSK